MPSARSDRRAGTRRTAPDPALAAADHAAREARREPVAPMASSPTRAAWRSGPTALDAERARGEDLAGARPSGTRGRSSVPSRLDARQWSPEVPPSCRRRPAFTRREPPASARRLVVARARRRPSAPDGRRALLPERGAGLEVIHDEAAGVEGVAAMPPARHGDSARSGRPGAIRRRDG